MHYSEAENSKTTDSFVGWFNKHAGLDVAATALDAASKQLREYGQAGDRPDEDATMERREDVPVSVLVRSSDNKREEAVAPSVSSRQSKAASVTSDNKADNGAATISSKSKASTPSVSSRQSKIASVKANNTASISSKGYKAAPSVSSRRSKAASVNSDHAIDNATAPLGDDVPDAKKSRRSVRSSLSSMSKKEGDSRKSSAKASSGARDGVENMGTVRTTKPLEMIEIDNIPSKHSSRKKQTEAEFWSSLSIRVALAVMIANGSEQIAQKASRLVLDEGQIQKGQDRSIEMIQSFSVELSLALLNAGVDEKVASAVAVAVLESQSSVQSDDGSTIATVSTARSNRSKASKTSRQAVSTTTPSLSPKRKQLQSIEEEMEAIKMSIEEAELRRIKALESAMRELVRRGNEFASIDKEIKAKNRAVREEGSVAPSLASEIKRQQLQSIEKEIEAKRKAIKEAELWNLEREKEFYERIAMLEAATHARTHGWISSDLDDATAKSELKDDSLTYATATSRRKVSVKREEVIVEEDDDEGSDTSEEQEEQEDNRKEKKVSLWRRLSFWRSKSRSPGNRGKTSTGGTDYKSDIGSKSTERTTNTRAVRKANEQRVPYHQTLPRRRFCFWKSKKIPRGCYAI